jgi:hypothetical protein
MMLCSLERPLGGDKAEVTGQLLPLHSPWSQL